MNRELLPYLHWLPLSTLFLSFIKLSVNILNIKISFDPACKTLA